jgi:dTDP-4-amino-4,6-dideoxygalactose transaminase
MNYYKKYCYKASSGTAAIVDALSELRSKKVIIPSYTCMDLYDAAYTSLCDIAIVDSGDDIQICVEDVISIADNYDTVIIPHMYGIRADVETIRKHTKLKIIEDLSQCNGLPGLGEFADVVVMSTNKSKWVDFNGGGFCFSNIYKKYSEEYEFSQHEDLIQSKYKKRTMIANEIKDAGIELIGKESSYLRAMYKQENSPREPEIPIHKHLGLQGFTKTEKLINNINWISILV